MARKAPTTDGPLDKAAISGRFDRLLGAMLTGHPSETQLYTCNPTPDMLGSASRAVVGHD